MISNRWHTDAVYPTVAYQEVALLIPEYRSVGCEFHDSLLQENPFLRGLLAELEQRIALFHQTLPQRLALNYLTRRSAVSLY